ncbi:hypothetical protein MSG28_015475 [Choristoneura fumiferana]|uniref:Uncharacterized protein n=1 Tax=Choristoneura fumiferana TaxID=7141 RepID=A0ACC0KAG9_CHOFU|nr:hypothetical protein MSG28_015475 [Choristoneura fumiferana]
MYGSKYPVPKALVPPPTMSEKRVERTEIINESIIKPEISLKYALLDTLEFDLDNPPVRQDDLMSFFGREHGQRLVQDDHTTYRDEHSAPFLYQTKSQLNLCVLSEHRPPKEAPTSPPPVLSELAISHSKVVCELKNALKSHDVLKHKDGQDRDGGAGFISNFKAKDEERECLVAGSQAQIVASSDNFFRTNFKSPNTESKYEKEYRSSVAKSSSELSQAEDRGFKPRPAPLTFSEFMCEITFEIYHELYGEGKHREETCTNLQSNSMVCVKFPIRTGPAWELLPKPSHSERRPVPSSGWDNYYKCEIKK